ncbi:cupin domain-containing protein [Streptomyces sp. NPDC058049]|uniref:cupin domain-containing protein n=1 Tax=Streptomyces sp. NPDC058049 TaxID=3346314 RepID=UPI0036E43C7E
MDALASLLYEVRSDGALFSRNVLAPSWSIRIADPTPIALATMLRGTGWIVPGGGEEPVALGEGDVAIVTGARPFTLADTADGDVRTPPLWVVQGPDRCTTADGAQISEEVLLLSTLREWFSRPETGPNGRGRWRTSPRRPGSPGRRSRAASASWSAGRRWPT